MKQNDEIENLFESTFDDFSVEPPPSVKVAIAEKIKFKKGFNKLWIFIPFSLLLISFIGFLLFNPSNSSDYTTITQADSPEHLSISEKNKLNSMTNQTDNLSISDKTTSSKEEKSIIPHLKDSKEKAGNKIQQKSIREQQNQTTENDVSVGKHKKTVPKNTENGGTLATQTKEKQTKTKANYTSKNKKSTGPTYNPTSKKDNLLTDVKHDFSKPNQNTTNGIANANIDHNQSEKYDLNNETNPTSTEDTNSSTEQKSKSTANNNSNSTEIPKTNAGTKPDSTTIKNELENSNSIIDTLPNILKPIDSTKIEKPTSSTASWLLSVRFGSSLAANTINDQAFSISEKNALFFNAEASYLFANNFNLTSGIQYNQFSTNLSLTKSFLDSLATGIDSLCYPNPNDTTGNSPDTTIYFTTYEYVTSNAIHRQVYSQTSVSIPLYFGYNYKINDHWFMDLNGGIVFSYLQAKLVSSNPQIPDPTIRSFGMKACFRPQIRYQINNKLGVSISSNFGYDFVPTLNWEETARKRIYSEFGIGFHYGF